MKKLYTSRFDRIFKSIFFKEKEKRIDGIIDSANERIHIDGISQNKLKTAKKLLEMLYANKRYYKSDKFTRTKSY